MSATINIQMFSDYFFKCPIILVPGRIFPITTLYFPIEDEKVETKQEKRAKQTTTTTTSTTTITTTSSTTTAVSKDGSQNEKDQTNQVKATGND